MRRIQQGMQSRGISELGAHFLGRLGKRRIALVCRIGLVLYLVALGLATHMPSHHLRRFPWHIQIPDKVAHFAAYAMLAALAVIAALSFGAVRRLRPSAWVVVTIGGLLLVACLGLFDEATQPAVGRNFDWFDWAADLAGAATAAMVATALAYFPMQKRLKTRSRMSSV